ncbi:MAG: nicotinate-nucleotide adenylyltransferase [Bacteroidales bacterium]|jgi:nicotinate-nucleotide adenylyltransferase|nr:nicotinate-nucleotide adenylyltransferase [Bacteroidales bacterium]
MHIGLYFGSFNPVHNGHIAIAEYMYQHFHFEEIWFVVSPSNPAKKEDDLLDEYKRLELVKIAIKDKSYFIPSDIEFYMQRPSYTCFTLQEIHTKYPANHFSLILGSDNIDNIALWKNYKEILQNYIIYVYPRSKQINRILQKNIIYTNPKLLDISSTFIREKIKNKENVSTWLHPKVLEIIEQENLYQ